MVVQKDISERENLINFVFKERLESVGLGSTIMRGSAKDSLGASLEYAALANNSMSQRRRMQGGGDDPLIDIHEESNNQPFSIGRQPPTTNTNRMAP